MSLRVALSERNEETGPYPPQIIVDTLKFSNVSTGNITKEGIVVIKSTTDKAIAIVLQTESDTKDYTSECGENRRYDKKQQRHVSEYVV